MSTLSITEEELKRVGLHYTVVRGNKHYNVKADGLPLIVCSVSCSDKRRGEVQARSLVRRLIRQNGLGDTA